MVDDQPSSDDLIKRAKESLRAVAEVRDAEMQASVEGIEEDTTSTTPAERPVPQSQARRTSPLAKATRPARGPAVKRRVPPSAERTSEPAVTASGPLGTGSGMILRIVGSAIVLMVGVMWLLLLIGIIDDQSDIGETLGGGALLTLIPLAIGILFRRAGIRRGTRV